MNTTTQCPRCHGHIPNNEHPGAYAGALSRVDNTTEICSACGTEEALQQYSQQTLTPISEWPVTREKEDS